MSDIASGGALDWVWTGWLCLWLAFVFSVVIGIGYWRARRQGRAMGGRKPRC